MRGFEATGQPAAGYYYCAETLVILWLQGSFQVCLKSVQGSEEAQSFLADGCHPLKAAFAFDSLLLRPAAAGVPPGGQTILWSASLSSPTPAVYNTDCAEFHHQTPHNLFWPAQRHTSMP